MFNRVNVKKRRTGVLLLCLLVSIAGITGCGKKGTDAVREKVTEQIEYTYVPKVITLATNMVQTITDCCVMNDRVYYVVSEKAMDSSKALSVTIYTRDLLRETPIPEEYAAIEDNQHEGTSCAFQKHIVAESGDIISIYEYQSSTDLADKKTILYKENSQGTVLFQTDISEYVNVDNEFIQIKCVCEDKKGNIFISNGSTYICIFDPQGNAVKTINLDGGGKYGNFIQEFGRLEDGRVGYLSANMDEHVLRVYNETKKEFTDIYDNLPNDYWGGCFSAGVSNHVLLCGGNGLYDYDLETEAYTEVVQWSDVDIKGEYVSAAYLLTDGNIAVLYDNKESGESNIVLLKRVEKSEVKTQKTLVLSCMSMNQSIQQQVVHFNKNNEEYKIEIKNYGESVDWAQETSMADFQAAMMKFHTDLITGNAGDMFLASDIDLGMLLSKGVVEDLTPFLNKSSVLKKDDLIQQVLDAHTIEGKLCTIPAHFTVQTICGRESELGNKSGWTMTEMIQYATKYPETLLFPYACDTLLADYCLMYDFDSYVNYEKGECNFNTEDFRMLLELADKYPSAMDVDYTVSRARLIRKHEALLEVASFSSPFDWQVVKKMFDEPITAIGFPSSQSTGVLVRGEDGICMNSQSENKDAVWKFIESMFTNEEGGSSHKGFDTLKARYDVKMQEAMKPEYKLDDDGVPLLDTEGNPIELPQGGINWEGIVVDIYSVKQEEADAIWQMIEQIDGTVNNNTQLMDIVNEELFPFFDGTKSMDDAIDIIQRRIQIYVNENSK